MVELIKLKIRKEHSNEKFGRLLTVEYAGSLISNLDNRNIKTSKQYYKCLCDCGVYIIVDYQSLSNNITKTCGKCPAIQGAEHGLWKGHGEISKDLYNSWKASAKKRNLEFTVSIKYLWDIFLQQNKKCILTGWDIFFSKNYKDRSNRTASPDRIDSSKGYIEGNIQWIHKDINCMKLDFNHEYFIHICRAVSLYNTPYSNSVSLKT